MTRETFTLSVGGLRCGHCVETVSAAIRAVDGVSACRVDLETGLAEIEADTTSATRQALAKAIEQAGYRLEASEPPPLTSLDRALHPSVRPTETVGPTAGADKPVAATDARTQREYRLLDVDGMHCASCITRVEAALLGIPGVVEAHANLATNQASIVADRPSVATSQLVAAIREAGYDAQLAASPEEAAESMFLREQQEARFWRRRLIVAVVLLGPILLAGRLSSSRFPQMGGWVQFLLATLVQFYVGWPYVLGAWRRLRHGSTNMDTLIALGTGTAYVAGIVGLARGAAMLTFHDAAMILTFITLGKYLEVKAKGRASRAIRHLLELTPPRANLMADGHVTEVPVRQVAAGQKILVRPGDKIPLDATVVAGQSDVDQAWLTGESIPVDKKSGDTIFAGTINGSGSLEALVLKTVGQTTLAQTIELVRKAQESKADVQHLADRVVAWFVPAVMAVATVTLIVWLSLGDVQTALTCMVSVLIVACPCALGLATPTAILVGGGRGAEHGILIKNAQALEQAGRVDTVVLDKTGTITTGKPQVVHVATSPGTDPRRLLDVAGAAETLSGHPLAKAVASYARSARAQIPQAQELKVVPGEGIVAQFEGELVVVGTESLLERHDVDLSALDREELDQRRGAGQTALLVAHGRRYLGSIMVADPVAAHSATAVQQLSAAGLDVLMLSGDRQATAEAVARQVGIRQVISEVRPGEKQDVVRRLQREGRHVAMVGDGINDAPALAAADLGIAIGSGADVAIESADIVLTQQDLRKVVEAIGLSRTTLRTIRQNLAWAFAYNVTLLPLAAGLIVPITGKGVLMLMPACSAAAMAMSSVSVVSNSLLLRTKKLSLDVRNTRKDKLSDERMTKHE